MAQDSEDFDFGSPGVPDHGAFMEEISDDFSSPHEQPSTYGSVVGGL
jgi:hypothetical protein